MTLYSATTKSNTSISLRTFFLAAVFLFGLLSVTTLQIFVHPHSALAASDTYPAPWAPPTPQDSMFDTWREYNRECTSYAAWMLHSVNGFEMPFHDDAVNWGTDAKSMGYTVNSTPAVGSIFWSTTSDHVAWVESVSSDGKTITTEDYNSGYPINPGWWKEHPGVAASSASGYIHFKDISSSAPLRISVVDKSGTFQVKESDLGAQWTYEYSGVTQGVVSGTLIGELSSGAFQVKQGGLTAFWTNEWTPTGTPIAGALSDASGSAPLRIGEVTNDGHFYVKEGSLTAPWADQWPAGGVIAGYVSGTRIGILTNDGIFRVKDGGLDAQWTIEDYNVTQGILSGSLIGEIKSSGVYNVKQGGLDAQWTTEWAGGAKTGTLSDATSNTALRIGFVDSSGVFRVKEGGLSTQWVTEATVSQGVVSGGLVGALEGSSFYVKQGRLDAGWTDEWDNTTAGSLWSL